MSAEPTGPRVGTGLRVGAVLASGYAVAALAVGLWRGGGLGTVATVAEFLAAAVAAGSAARTAGRCSGRSRQSWLWLAAGSASWALGEAYWVALDPLFGADFPVPSPADAGFLLLPPCFAVGLIRHPSVLLIGPARWLRFVLDGTTVLLALLLAVRHTPVAEAWQVRPGDVGSFVAASYPVADVALIAIMVALLTYGMGHRQPHLLWLQAGLVAFAGADTIFCTLAARGEAGALSVADPLWIAGFLGIAAAAVGDRGVRPAEGECGSRAPAGRGTRRDAQPEVEGRDSPLRTTVPFATVVVAGLFAGRQWLSGTPVTAASAGLLAALGLLVYLRQYLLLYDNRRLGVQVDDGREQLRRSGLHDASTGLPNREGFLDLLEAALADPARRSLAVVKLRPNHPDLLDPVDDGTGAGLHELAEIVARCLTPGDRLARVGDATLAVLTGRSQEGAVAFARAVMLAVEESTPDLPPGLAAGIAVAGPAAGPAGGGPTAADLTHHAMMALNTVASVPDAVAVFTPKLLRDHTARRRLHEAVVRTLRTDPSAGVDVLFEPVVDLGSGSLVGVAARPEWRHEGDTTVPAGRLIALAREAHLAGRVDGVVLRTAVTGFADWTGRWSGICDRLWVTLCIETLNDPAFPDRLRDLLAEVGLAADALVIDPLDDLHQGPHGRTALPNLHRLRELGVHVAVGNTMALLEYGDSPDGTNADYFGISPTAVERCVDDPRARHLVQATVEFAATHRAVTAARQVSTVEQHEALRELGCSVARGPLYGVPLPAPETARLIASAADGSWQTPVSREVTRRRSSRAWQDLRQVISVLPVAAFAYDTAGKVVLAEGALLDQLAITAGPLGQPVGTMILGTAPRNRRASFEAAVRGTLRGRPSVTTVLAHGHWLQVHLSPQRDGDGAVTGAFGVAIDVTHRFQAEQALRASEQRFRSIFTQAPVGMAIISPDARLLQVNPALATMLGYTPQELAGRRVNSLWHPETPAESADQFEALRVGEIAGYHGERAYLHRDGSAVWGRVTIARFSDAAAAEAMIGIVEDMRKIKQLEVDLRHAQKLEAVGMLAAGIAHEINTPIQFVGDNINFLGDAFGQLSRVLTAALRRCGPVDDPANIEIAELTDEIDLPWLLDEVPNATAQSLEGVARVATIVRAMRNFGHPDQRDPTPVDVNAAIRDTSTIARNEYKYVADLELDLNEVPPVLGYPSEFHQVMLNLIVNAAHAIADAVGDGGRRGTITVRSWVDETAAHVSVTDDGCGMTPETKARIFDPFFTTKEVGRGTGQGLTIVYHVVVEKHGGTVEVSSTPGEGSTFTVHLPRRIGGETAATTAPALAVV